MRSSCNGTHAPRSPHWLSSSGGKQIVSTILPKMRVASAQRTCFELLMTFRAIGDGVSTVDCAPILRAQQLSLATVYTSSNSAMRVLRGSEAITAQLPAYESVCGVGESYCHSLLHLRVVASDAVTERQRSRALPAVANSVTFKDKTI